MGINLSYDAPKYDNKFCLLKNLQKLTISSSSVNSTQLIVKLFTKMKKSKIIILKTTKQKRDQLTKRAKK